MHVTKKMIVVFETKNYQIFMTNGALKLSSLMIFYLFRAQKIAIILFHERKRYNLTAL